MRPNGFAVYLRLMMDREERPENRPAPGAHHVVDWLAFRPWMLAAAVLLACALGIAVMEHLHAREMWAQLSMPAGR